MHRVRRVALCASAIVLAAAGSAIAVPLVGGDGTPMSISGQITDSAGRGLAGMCVETEATYDGSTRAPTGSSTTDANGYYEITWMQKPNSLYSSPYNVRGTADCGAH